MIFSFLKVQKTASSKFKVIGISFSIVVSVLHLYANSLFSIRELRIFPVGILGIFSYMTLIEPNYLKYKNNIFYTKDDEIGRVEPKNAINNEQYYNSKM